MPPPAPVALFWVTVLCSTVSGPLVKMPPPSPTTEKKGSSLRPSERLPENVLFSMIAVPPLKIVPPARAAAFSTNVLLRTVSVPSLEIPPPISQRAGIRRIPVRAHVIRHSIASAAASMGATVHELADMLNHSDTNTVKRYVHGITQDAALSKVRALLDTPATPTAAPRRTRQRHSMSWQC